MVRICQGSFAEPGRLRAARRTDDWRCGAAAGDVLDVGAVEPGQYLGIPAAAGVRARLFAGPPTARRPSGWRAGSWRRPRPCAPARCSAMASYSGSVTAGALATICTILKPLAFSSPSSDLIAPAVEGWMSCIRMMPFLAPRSCASTVRCTAPGLRVLKSRESTSMPKTAELALGRGRPMRGLGVARDRESGRTAPRARRAPAPWRSSPVRSRPWPCRR